MGMHRFALLLALLSSFTAAASNDITGVVLDANAKPLAGANVYVYAARPRIGIGTVCPTCYRDCGKKQLTNEAGAFTLQDLDPTLVFDVLAIADGREPQFANRVDPKTGPVTISLRARAAEPERTIKGVVLDLHGKPMIGATVEPGGYHVGNRTGYGELPGLDRVSITNAAGEFALRMPDANGLLDVRVTARGNVPHIERRLAPGEVRRIALREGSIITGRLVRDGKPVAGARVVAVQEKRLSSGWLGPREIGTSEDGSFVLTDLAPDETWVVYVPMQDLARGVVEPRLVSVPGSGDADAGKLEVKPGRRIAGTIVLPQGESFSGDARVALSVVSSGDTRFASVNPNGTFAFDEVPESDIELGVQMRGWRLASEERVLRVLPGECVDLRLQLAR
jgi:hypothetical protein